MPVICVVISPSFPLNVPVSCQHIVDSKKLSVQDIENFSAWLRNLQLKKQEEKPAVEEAEEAEKKADDAEEKEETQDE